MEIDKMEDFVNVAIRIRPHIASDTSFKECLKVISRDRNVLHVLEKQQTYSFDHIFSEESTQQSVYNEMVKPLVDKVIDGYNSTVFAYGQTGTGKTFTIGTDSEKYLDEDSGLITRTLVDIFNCNDENKEISILISFYEIYNEKVYDLLKPNNVALVVKGFKINGLSQAKVMNCEDAKQLLSYGGKNRHVGETKKNNSSSRSHAIFTIYCNVKHYNHVTEAKLNLVDLAGSESIKKTGNEGSQLHEGININKGLLCIGQVINALSSNRQFIPYRQSTITTILQDSLSKKNFVSLIACVGPNVEDVHETVHTLDFAQRAKKLKSKPELNNIAMEYTKTNPLILSVLKPKKISRPLHTSTVRKQLPFRTPLKSSYSMNAFSRYSKQSRLSMQDALCLDHNISDSIEHTSVSTINDVTTNLSPIVRKCIDAVESSIMTRLEDMMKIMQTPAVRSSPRFNWDTLQTEVVKIVQTEYSNLKSRSAKNKDHDKHLDFDGASPISSLTERKEISVPSPLFKVPLALPRKLIRKSSRLSSMKTMSPMTTSSPIKTSPKVNYRRSVRLSMKMNNTIVKPKPCNPPANISTAKKRKSKAPVPAPRKVHYKKTILDILNNGSESELLKLNSIGVKTASMITSFRSIKGKFTKISDLEKMPWRGNGYKRFLNENFLNDT